MFGHETDQNYILNLPLTGESIQCIEPARLSELSERDKVGMNIELTAIRLQIITRELNLMTMPREFTSALSY